MTLDEIFQNFRGDWVFDRVITGQPQQGKANGTAQFTALDVNTLLYREDGTLTLDHTTETASFYRHYLYQLQDNRIDVLYHDGPQKGESYQSYQVNSDGALSAAEPHHCALDDYDGYYDIHSNEAFTLTTRVKGPTDDYTIVTKFKRTP